MRRNLLKENAGILAILAIFVGIRLLFMLKPHQVIWDESVYIGIGKYIYSLGHSGLWEMIRPIGLPLVLGLFWKIGLSPVVFGELVAIAFSAANITLVYLIGKQLFGKKTGIVAALCLALTPLFFLYSGYILTEIPSATFALAALFAYLKKKSPILAGVFTGLAILFRFPQLLIVPAFVIIFAAGKKRWQAILNYFAAVFVVLLPFFALNYVLYSPYTSNFFHAVFRPFILGAEHQSQEAYAIAGFFSNILYYPLALLRQGGFHIFSLVGVARIIMSEMQSISDTRSRTTHLGRVVLDKNKRFRRMRHLSVLVILLVLFAYFAYIQNKQERYALSFLPFLAVLTAYGIMSLYLGMLSLKKRMFRYASVFALSIFLIAAFFMAAETDREYYKWRASEEFPIAKEFYSYFLANPVEGAVLTTDPVPAAYSDTLFVPYYFFLSGRIEPYNEWERSAQISAIIYTPRAFYCREGDSECSAKKEQVFQQLSEKNKLIFKGSYNSQDYFIFRT